LDANKNGVIEYDEFMKMMEERVVAPDNDDDKEESYRQAFRVFDRDNSGKISAEELRY
jgi:calmodulin